MTKRLIDIDDATLRMAQEALGTKTLKDTVAIALREVVAGEARRREIQRLTSGQLAELADPDARARLWQR